MLVDLPLSELLTYSGRNPKPADFDAYWDESLAEMRAVDPSLVLDPVDIPSRYADCFDLWFTGVGSARQYAKLIVPKDRTEPGPALVRFHGYTMSSGDWTSYLHWAAQGFTVAVLDCRGQGGRSEDKGGVQGNTLQGHIIRGLVGEPKDLLFRSIFLDCAQLAGIVMGFEWVDERRVGAAGGSQGGALSVACAALEPRIARLAPEYPFLSDYKRVWEMDLAKDAYDELRSWFRRFDPRHEREDWVWERLGYVDIQHLAPRVRGETLWFVGLMDTVCPPSTQFAAYNKLGGPKEYVLYPDFGHEGLPGSGDLAYRFLCGL